MINQSISHYRITAKLGAGGMGEVYCATDTKLRREVALKVLPSSVASDPQRMARFEREAQLLAALNHPNIAAIYGLEDSGAVRALVIELVEGVALSPGFRAGKSRVLYQGDIWNDASGPNFALARGGKRLVVVERSSDSTGDTLQVVLNWNEELLRLTGSSAK